MQIKIDLQELFITLASDHNSCVLGIQLNIRSLVTFIVVFWTCGNDYMYIRPQVTLIAVVWKYGSFYIRPLDSDNQL